MHRKGYGMKNKKKYKFSLFLSIFRLFKWRDLIQSSSSKVLGKIIEDTAGVSPGLNPLQFDFFFTLLKRLGQIPSYLQSECRRPHYPVVGIFRPSGAVVCGTHCMNF
jgi:hypothetical protein